MAQRLCSCDSVGNGDATLGNREFAKLVLGVRCSWNVGVDYHSEAESIYTY